jgi:hypothetical protein
MEPGWLQERKARRGAKKKRQLEITRKDAEPVTGPQRYHMRMGAAKGMGERAEERRAEERKMRRGRYRARDRGIWDVVMGPRWRLIDDG